MQLYTFAGEIDMEIAIASFRKKPAAMVLSVIAE